METGTGKTYVYIKTIMELHKRYGWSKYIIVVPSVAIREGVKKSFDVTAEHFQQLYGTKPRSFIYNSSQLHELERFSSDAGVQVMIINIQAFNATGKDNRRIYDELDDFQSRRPIDVISANRPIVIIDEPQKIGAPKSLEALSRFNALMLLRYSATHKVDHTKVHRLDALDAYNQKLVKKIAVRGITVKGLAGRRPTCTSTPSRSPRVPSLGHGSRSRCRRPRASNGRSSVSTWGEPARRLQWDRGVQGPVHHRGRCQP
jgi:type III restriction enzyme